VLGLGDAEREVTPAGGEVVDPLLALRGAAVVQHQQQRDVVTHDRVLVLEIAVQAEALAGQVLADDRHAEVGPVPAAVFLRERIPVVAGRVGPPPGLGEQRLPVAAGQPAAVPVGSGVLPAVVEEPDVVVLLLERLDLALDELVEFFQVLPQVLGQIEVHVLVSFGAPDRGSSGSGQVAGVGDRELVDGRGADRRDDIVEAVIERLVADGRAELGIVGAAESGEPGPVVARVPGGEHGLALGDPQRVRRDPGMKRQGRFGHGDLGGEELPDRAEQAGTGRPVVGCRGRPQGVLQGVGLASPTESPGTPDL